MAPRSRHRIHSDDINNYLKEVFSADVTAKAFRTWHPTVLAAVGLAVSTTARTPTQRRQAVARAMREVSGYLGNTPAVAKSSYVDPRIVDRYLAGDAIVDSLPTLGKDTATGHMATEGPVEKAVIAILDG
nr:hypothetical protein [Actinopolymorpha pittospori]